MLTRMQKLTVEEWKSNDGDHLTQRLLEEAKLFHAMPHFPDI